MQSGAAVEADAIGEHAAAEVDAIGEQLKRTESGPAAAEADASGEQQLKRTQAESSS